MRPPLAGLVMQGCCQPVPAALSTSEHAMAISQLFLLWSLLCALESAWPTEVILAGLALTFS